MLFSNNELVNQVAPQSLPKSDRLELVAVFVNTVYCRRVVIVLLSHFIMCQNKGSSAWLFILSKRNKIEMQQFSMAELN